jgi:hypothetical protein
MDQIKFPCRKSLNQWRPAANQSRPLSLQAFFLEKSFRMGD